VSSVSEESNNQIRKQSSKSQQRDSFTVNFFTPDEEPSRTGPVKFPEFSFNSGPQFSISRVPSSIMIAVDSVQEERRPSIAPPLNGGTQAAGTTPARRDTLSAQRLTSVRRKSSVMMESMVPFMQSDAPLDASVSMNRGLRFTPDRRPSAVPGNTVTFHSESFCSVMSYSGVVVGSETHKPTSVKNEESAKPTPVKNEKRGTIAIMPRQSFAKWNQIAERKGVKRGSAMVHSETGRAIEAQPSYVFTDEGRKLAIHINKNNIV
jgi:hypothetical protein